MTKQELSDILTQPDSISLAQVYELENIIHEFPYFQAARVVHLKVLFTQGSYRYNKALKVTASQVGDRTVLFDFITSNAFKKKNINLQSRTPSMPQTYYDQAIPAEFAQFVGADAFEPVQKNQPAMRSIVGEFTPSSDKNREIEQKLQMGKPLDFEQNDPHSFSQWLELTRYKPIERGEKTSEKASGEKNIFQPTDERAKKFDLIDKFLEKNPKIEAKKDYESTIDLGEHNPHNTNKLMTETLAKVYLEQGKYDEAIRAYQILILKNPEKSRFFAEQISAIKKIQQNNNL